MSIYMKSKRTLLVIIFSLVGFSTSFSQSKVTFKVSNLPVDGPGSVGIRGNTAPLSWQYSQVLAKDDTGYSITLEFEQDFGEVEFKFVLFDDDANPIWETTENRTIQLKSGSIVISENKWDLDQIIDISSLPLLTPDELLADFELIKTMVLEVHPGTYRYRTEKEIEQALDELKKALSKTQSHGEAYLAMSKMTAFLQCDHTKVGFNNQNRVINSIIHRQADKLPFTFKWFGEQMIVEYDATSAMSLQKGTEIISINGTPVSEIQSSMFPYIAADGATDGNRLYKMEVGGYDFRYNAFDVFYPLIYPIEGTEVELEIIKPDKNDVELISTTLMTREERSEVLGARFSEFPKTRDDMWGFEMVDEKTALLTINSFGAFGWKAMTIDWRAFLEGTFKTIEEQGVEHLIIDIRENNGGADEMAIELFSYLDVKESVSKQRYREGRTRYLNFPESLKPYVQTWGENPWFFNMEANQNESGYYVFPNNGDRFSKGEKYSFNGEVYLLSSSANTSLAFYTNQNFRRHQLGTIIGTETGGNLRDINGGQILFLRLPNSGIEIDFPVMGGFSLNDYPNKGVSPDIEVAPSIDDFINDRDVVLEKTLQLIENDE